MLTLQIPDCGYSLADFETSHVAALFAYGKIADVNESPSEFELKLGLVAFAAFEPVKNIFDHIHTIGRIAFGHFTADDRCAEREYALSGL